MTLQARGNTRFTAILTNISSLTACAIHVCWCLHVLRAFIVPDAATVRARILAISRSLLPCIGPEPVTRGIASGSKGQSAAFHRIPLVLLYLEKPPGLPDGRLHFWAGLLDVCAEMTRVDMW